MKKLLTKNEKELCAQELARFFDEVAEEVEAGHQVYWKNVWQRSMRILKGESLP